MCNAARSSVLFDSIPTLTGLAGDMWASQLLTLNTSTSTASITFDFTSGTNQPTVFVGIELIEVVMFNCPAREIGTNNVQVSANGQVADNIAVSESCDYLVRGCSTAISLSLSTRAITLSFRKTYPRLYFAEITFYSSMTRQCSPVGPLNASVESTSEQTSTTSASNEENTSSKETQYPTLASETSELVTKKDTTSSSNKESTSNKETHHPSLSSETTELVTNMDTTSYSNQGSSSNKETHHPTLSSETSELAPNMDTTSYSNQESTSNKETHHPTLSSETSKLVINMDTTKLAILKKDFSTNNNALFSTIASNSETIFTRG